MKVVRIPVDETGPDQLRSEGMPDEQIREYYRGVLDRCLEEIRKTHTLQGRPNIVCFDDCRVMPEPEGIGWVLFARMPLLTSLKKQLETDPDFSQKQITRLGTDLTRALEICEEQGIEFIYQVAENDAMKQAGIAYATDQIIDLYANGITNVHVYSMNNADVATKILHNLSDIIKND